MSDVEDEVDCDHDEFDEYVDDSCDEYCEDESKDDSADGSCLSTEESQKSELPIKFSSTGCTLTVAHLTTGNHIHQTVRTVSLEALDDGVKGPDYPETGRVDVCTSCGARVRSHAIGDLDFNSLLAIVDGYFPKKSKVEKEWLAWRTGQMCGRLKSDCRVKAENVRKKKAKKKKADKKETEAYVEEEERQGNASVDAVSAIAYPTRLGGAGDAEAVSSYGSEAQENALYLTIACKGVACSGVAADIPNSSNRLLTVASLAVLKTAEEAKEKKEAKKSKKANETKKAKKKKTVTDERTRVGGQCGSSYEVTDVARLIVAQGDTTPVPGAHTQTAKTEGIERTHGFLRKLLSIAFQRHQAYVFRAWVTKCDAKLFEGPILARRNRGSSYTSSASHSRSGRRG